MALIDRILRREPPIEWRGVDGNIEMYATHKYRFEKPFVWQRYGGYWELHDDFHSWAFTTTEMASTIDYFIERVADCVELGPSSPVDMKIKTAIDAHGVSVNRGA